MPSSRPPADPPQQPAGAWRPHALLLAVCLCSLALSGWDRALLDPAGSIAAQEENLLLVASALLLLVVIPVISMTVAYLGRHMRGGAT
jgi:cytochrome o ubiquinol oxidase subunit 2